METQNEKMPVSGSYFDDGVDHKAIRYPHSVVWTPIPCLT